MRHGCRRPPMSALRRRNCSHISIAFLTEGFTCRSCGIEKLPKQIRDQKRELVVIRGRFLKFGEHVIE